MEIDQKYNKKCWYSIVNDTVEYTIFHYPRFHNYDYIAYITEDNISEVMLHDDEKWSNITKLIKPIMIKKEDDEKPQ